MTDLRIGIDGDEDAERSLADWLRLEPALRGRVRTRPVPPSPGSMGAFTELVITGVTTGLIAVLMESIKVWIGQRRGPAAAVPVSIAITTEDGETVSVSAGTVEQADEALRIALERSGDGSA
ncbi:hypothetical protein Val02_64480 [Virgisporangium aliadipatigenens]|uniref:Uncharacterized protein n=1 Tax=Virgisporangium aliadipatigenens TaxID=741659 RepID=A0A8J3YRZ2_9ACTN|nr:hypothetical protein [Virgisporangium aliadipatigenens]GIJ49562.1 hypothetical protein Val02_64480 [Virgisporangium aliadipatigenens]